MAVPEYRLYSPTQIAVAAFLGSPLAACWLISHNYRRLQRRHHARQSLTWGILGTALLITISVFIPPYLGSAIGPACTFAIFQACKSAFGTIVAFHVSEGGQLGSWFTVISISILCALIALVVVFIYILTLTFLGFVR